jgi:GDPmannose 4,6-dehydratase
MLDLDPKQYIEIDQRYFRPAEVDLLLGDCSKAKEKLGWSASTSLEELARLMVDNDLSLAREEAIIAAARK